MFDKGLVMANGKNITADVVSCEYSGDKCRVTFSNGKVYSYFRNNVKVYNEYTAIDPEPYRITHNERELFNIHSIMEFNIGWEKIWRIIFSNGEFRDYSLSELDIKKSCLDDEESANCLHYLARMADLNDLKDDDGNRILSMLYTKVERVENDTVLARYLNPCNSDIITEKTISNDICPVTPIFPFGCNSSQYTAVDNALKNSISIVEGPPGTGKTQTILNLVSNLIIQGKSIQIVSNNNAATDNVIEKMNNEKYAIGFIAARLGSRDNKKSFCDEQSGEYPDISNWKYTGEVDLKEKIKGLSEELKGIYLNQQKLAKLKEKYSGLTIEFEHFSELCKDSGFITETLKIGKRANPERINKILTEIEIRNSISSFTRLKCIIFSGIGPYKIFSKDVIYITLALRYAFLVSSISEVKRSISETEAILSGCQSSKKEKELEDLSLTLLRDYLYRKYGNKTKRTMFKEEYLFRSAGSFIEEYPVVLSTTFSSLSCINTTFDYIIIDESSQADISTGVLALNSAKNAVIVGDCCQLPFVLDNQTKKTAKAIFESYKLSEGYDFSSNSFLDSVKKIFSEAPAVVLREHYRCHPKIIGFCNQKFYGGELVIMTGDSNEDALLAIRTVSGDHARGKFNQRQVDVIVNEILPSLEYDPEDIGIIAPYNDQIDALKLAVNNEKIQIATVHKFQGREKKVIIFCTVDNEIKEFVDDPKLLNVAISRAIDRFILVTGNDKLGDGNISDLISYIEYNNFEVSESKIYSVFDMLYEANTKERIKYLEGHKKVSAYDSENLMYVTLKNITSGRSEYEIGCHIPLSLIIKEKGLLSPEEYKYVSNQLTHVDFLIYNKVSKKPVLVVEVDGFNYHKEGSQQAERDKIKNSVLSKYDIPFIRLSTTGNNEIAKISEML